MNIAIIGRSKLLYNTAIRIAEDGHKIPLIITAKEAPEYNIKANDFSKLASKFNANFIKTGNLNREDIIGVVRKSGKLDIAISINYPGIISQKVIDLFLLGILNTHGGDLPRYRGNACQAWAIINREQEVVLCIHKMIGGEVDSGRGGLGEGGLEEIGWRREVEPGDGRRNLWGEREEKHEKVGV